MSSRASNNRLRLAAIVLLAAATHLPLAGQTVALAPFAHVEFERNDPSVNGSNLDLLLVRLAAKTPYQFVERSEVDRLIAEQTLELQGLANTGSAAQLGRLLRADIILTGTCHTPLDGQAYVVLHAVEALRADVLAKEEVKVGAILSRGTVTTWSAKDADSLSAACIRVLRAASDEVESRKQHILVKLLALGDSADDRPRYRADWLTARFESELARRAEASTTHRFLRTDRADAAIEESELNLLGLAANDPTAWEPFADYFLWGDQEPGGVLRLFLSDGASTPRELRLPLPDDASQIDEVIGAAYDSIIAATPHSKRSRRVRAFEQSRETSKLLHRIAQQAHETKRSDSFARRLATAAIFFDPGFLDPWNLLAQLREDSQSKHAFISYRLKIRSRFLVDAQGRIRTEAIVPGDLSSVFFSNRDRISRREKDDAFFEARKRTVALTVAESLRAAELLATAAPGQDEAFISAATSIFSDLLQPKLPYTLFEPDTAAVDRAVELLWQRFKVAAAVADAWGHPNPFLATSSDTRDLIADYLCDRGRVEQAKWLGVLGPEELRAALASSPPSRSQPGRLLEAARKYEEAGDARNAAKQKALYETSYAAQRPRVERYLRARSTEAPQPLSALPLLWIWPQEYRQQVRTLSDVETAAANGNLEELERALRASVPPLVEANAFVSAIRAGHWPVVDYLLERGFDKKLAGWPALYQSVVQAGQWKTDKPLAEPMSESAGVWALTSALARNRLDLADRLIASGVSFKGSNLGAYVAWCLIRRCDSEALKRVLAAGGVAGSGFPSESPYFEIVIWRKDLATLRSLLEANARIDTVTYGSGYEKPSGLAPNSPDADRYPNHLCQAAAANWREGVEAMLAARSLSPLILHDRPLVRRGHALELPHAHEYAKDPAIRGMLLRATLRKAMPKPTSLQSAGIELAVGIATNDASAVSKALRNPEVAKTRILGHTPLTFAISEGSYEIVRLLASRSVGLNDADEEGHSPLSRAAQCGNVGLVRLLVGQGADINASQTTHSPLETALVARQEETALALLNLGAAFSGANYGFGRHNPLYTATERNLTKVVDRLLALGIDFRNPRDGNIMYEAVRSNNPQLIQRFFNYGCSLREEEGKLSLLQVAAEWGASDSVAKLLEMGLRDPRAIEQAREQAQRRLEDLQTGGTTVGKLLHYRPDVRRCLDLMLQYAEHDGGAPLAGTGRPR